MDKQILLLDRIQKIDLEILEIEEKNAKIPLKLHDFEKTLEKEETEIERLRNELKELESTQMRLNNEIEIEKERVVRDEDRLRGAASEKEYKALLKEIGNYKRSIDKKEGEVLEVMERIEEDEALLSEVEKRVETLKKEIEQKVLETRKEQEALEVELKERRKTRDGLIKEIQPQIFKRYEFIRKNRQGIAVVRVKDGTCLGCYMSLPPQTFIQVQRKATLVSCPHCNRILIWHQEGSSA